MASNPKGIKSGSIQRYLAREEKKEGFHQDLPPGVKRYAVKTAHGFRRFFETNAKRAGMDQTYIEFLMGHTLGIREHYLDADEFEILNDYIKGVNSLMINNDYQAGALIQKQVVELTKKNEQENYAILGRLAEKERETEDTKKELKQIKAEMTILQANTSNLLKVFMGHTNELVIHAWNKDEGPIETAKMIVEAEERNNNMN